jgi:serine/threonine-protein kinase
VVGETIGSYRILKQLGAGAMGQVYLAEHRHLKRQAALKLLARELVDRPDLLERFFLEARATSAIAHPGIVQIFDCEVDATGRPYIVMELLTGETLAALLARQGALPPLRVARLARSLADALEAAHGKGIVHRDLKPENMFVVGDSSDSTKLVDFGIAKLAGDLQAGQVHKTRSGAVMGTPLYMSPEQCRDSANIDFRTDLYSLGCVVYEMLTGRPPFVRDNFGDLMVAHITEPAPDARTVNAAVPAPLAELTRDLLNKDPAQRPPSMRAVSERLMTYVSRMTTVPGGGGVQPMAPTALPAAAVASSTAPPAAPVVRTTFGASASQVDDERPRPARRGAPIAVAVGLLAIGGAAAAFLLRGGPTTAEVAPAPAPAPAPAAPAPLAAAPAAAAEPAPAPAAVKTPAAEPEEPSSRKSGASSKKRRGGAAPTTTPAATAAASPRPTEPAAPGGTEARAAEPAHGGEAGGLTGAWEGPWVDAAHGQQGRLFLQIGGGHAAGWMYNTSAKQSYRMVGTSSPSGALDLTCQCPPTQRFVARGTLRLEPTGEVHGDVALSSAAGVFGQTRMTLKRTNAAR